MSVSTHTRQQEEERNEVAEHLERMRRSKNATQRKNEMLMADLDLNVEFLDECVQEITESRAYRDAKAALTKLWQLGDRPWELFAKAIEDIQDDEAKAAVLIEWMKTQQVNVQETTKIVIDVASRLERSVERAVNPVRAAKEKLRSLLKRNK